MRIVDIYSKIRRNGVAAQDDLNMLYLAGIVSQKELAKSIGINEKKMRKYTRAGKVGFEDIKKVLEDSTGLGGKFFNVMLTLSKTFTGRVSTLVGKFQLLIADVGGPLLGSMTSITDTLIDWVDQAKTMNGPIGLLLTNLKAAAAIMETMRKGGSLEKVTGLKDFGKADLLADTLASGSTSFLGAEINPLAAVGRGLQSFGFGAEAIGRQQMSIIDQETKELLKRSADAASKTAENTSNRRY
jgi:hypothetical protein